MNNKLGQKYKIKNKSYIQLLFKYGIWITEKNIKLIYHKSNDFNSNFNFQYAISVSKKKLKHAVDRNKIKRLLRECIRLNKNITSKKLPSNAIFILIYRSNSISNFYILEKQYLNILKKIKNEFNFDY